MGHAWLDISSAGKWLTRQESCITVHACTVMQLWKGMASMAWQGTRAQHEALWQALNQLCNRDGIRLGRIATAVNADQRARESLRRWGQEESRDVIDATTLRRWHEGGPEKLQSALVVKKAPVYEFLECSREFQTALYNPTLGLPDGMLEFVTTQTDALSKLRFDRLSNLDGTYALYRRAWTTPERTDRVLISRLVIETAFGLTRYREEQDYRDDARGDLPVHETDHGLVFNSGTNVFLLGFGIDEERVKFFVIHAWRPSIDGNKPVHELKGTLIGATGEGPHPGFRFIAYRAAKSDSLKSRVVPSAEVGADIHAWLGCTSSAST
jgi:hypothetical protein